MLSVCRIVDLRCKEVINICDGARLGYAYDVEFDSCTGQIVAIVVPGPCRFFGLFGREDDYVIAWECITKIGEDIILVRYDRPRVQKNKERKKFFS